MGSRYGGDYRRSGDFGPPRSQAGGGGAGPRWDSERFAREREDRFRAPAAPVIERDRYEYEKDRFAGGGGFEERYFAEERYGPPARRPERSYYEQDEIIVNRRAPPADAMVPYRRREPSPSRPRLLRRQSSLDTFDRRPTRRYEEIDEYRPAPISIPVPPRRPSPPRYAPRPIEREVVEEVRVSEPGYYGDEEFRTYKEREWVNRRERRRSNSSEVRERIVEEEIIAEEGWPRKGKTKMPRKKVHLRAIIDLGYPFEEEGETVILLKALNKEQIDEVIALSGDYKKREEVNTTTTVHLIESGPPPPREEIIERVEKIVTVPMSEAPRSVREWDTLRVDRRSPSPERSVRSRRSKSTRSRHHSSHHSRREESSSSSSRSPARTVRTRRTSRSRAASKSRASSPSTIIEERRIVEIENRDESNSVHAGPLALVLPERHRRSDRDLEEEILELEKERRILKLERGTREREVIIERERPREEIVEVRKDKKASAPDPRLIRAMFKTLT